MGARVPQETVEWEGDPQQCVEVSQKSGYVERPQGMAVWVGGSGCSERNWRRGLREAVGNFALKKLTI